MAGNSIILPHISPSCYYFGFQPEIISDWCFLTANYHEQKGYALPFMYTRSFRVYENSRWTEWLTWQPVKVLLVGASSLPDPPPYHASHTPFGSNPIPVRRVPRKVRWFHSYTFLGLSLSEVDGACSQAPALNGWILVRDINVSHN